MKRGRLNRSSHHFKRAAQGSNLPLPDLESGVPPLELPAQSFSVDAQGGTRTPVGQRPAALQAAAIAALPPARLSLRRRGSPPRRGGRQGGEGSARSSQSAWKGSNLRPRVPETRALPTALHAGSGDGRGVMSDEQRGSFVTCHLSLVPCSSVLHSSLSSRLLPAGVEPCIFRLKAGDPGRWTTGALVS